jgi:anti-sigma factor RsiW
MTDLTQTKCENIRELLSAFLDMELTLSEVELVEAHLERCPACVNELAALERVIASVRSLPKLESRDFADDIEQRINTQIKSQAEVSQATVAPVANNVLPFKSPKASSTKKRQKLVLVAAAASIVLFGLVAQVSLHPQGPVEIAQFPTQHQSHIIQAEHKLDMDGGAASTAPTSDDIVALYDEESGNNSADVGISTNEDGLYAIKL